MTTKPRHSLAALLLALAFVPAAGWACGDFDHAHTSWTALLEKYVDAGRVDYARWKGEGLGDLDAYLGSLAAVTEADYESWTDDQRLAYWINTYNAYMARKVLTHFPVGSVKSIGVIPFSVFKKRFIPSPYLEGKQLSLDAVENSIIRQRFDDARIHFALVCAARSCPELRPEAFRAADLDAQLEDQGRRFLGDRSKNRYNPGTGKLYISKIFDWFKGDFRKSAGSVKKFVAPYLPDDARAALESGKAKLSYLKYDWTLNDG